MPVTITLIVFEALELQHIVFDGFEPDILRKPRERFILEILLSSNAELEKVQKVFNDYCRTDYFHHMN